LGGTVKIEHKMKERYIDLFYNLGFVDQLLGCVNLATCIVCEPTNNNPGSSASQ
jgi:hypothetical protein